MPVSTAATIVSTSSLVAFVYEKGGSDQTDILIETVPLASLCELAVSATRYVVIRDSADDRVKSIDNWATTPAAPQGA